MSRFLGSRRSEVKVHAEHWIQFLWLRKRCRSCSSKSFFFKVKRSLFMCGHVSCSSFAAGLASVSQFVGPRLLKDTPSLVYRRSCRSTLRFARVGSASEACRKRVGSVSEARRKRVETASEPSRNRVGINRVGTESEPRREDVGPRMGLHICL